MADTAAPTTMSQTERQVRALQIVKANCGWSSAAGVIPVPLLDLAAIAGVQYRMVRQLTDLYGIPYNKRTVDSIVGALVGSGGVLIASPVAASLLKVVPVVGTFLSTLVVPATAAASTFALGKVFIQHFESGGTLLSLNPEAQRTYYYNEFRKAEAESKT